MDALLWVDRRLPQTKKPQYLNRLGLEAKHQDALAEIVAVGVLPDDLPVEFEVPSETGDGSIDWRVSPTQGAPLLFDVKNRVFDLIQQLEAMTVSQGQVGPKPAHDPLLLFRSVATKFQRHDASTCLHGVWVFTRVKQPVEELSNAFFQLDPDLVHFAVISNRSRECYVMTRPGVDRERVVAILQLRENPDRITFSIAHEG